MRRRFLCFLLSLLLAQFSFVANAQYQPMGIRIGSYSLAANGATNVSAFCLNGEALSPKPGVNYNTVGYGAENAYLITSKGEYTIKEALDMGIISITGADGGVSHDRLVFRNNTNEVIKFEVKDDFVIKTKDDSYEHVGGILNTGLTQGEMWDAIERKFEDQKRSRLLLDINANASNRVMVVSYENTGTAIKYTIENGQKNPIYSGNNFRDMARLTNTGSSQRQYFILKGFPTFDRETAFLRSVELANQNVAGYRATRLVSNDLELVKLLMQENPTLLRIGTTESGNDFRNSITADIEINRVEYEVIAEADNVSLLTAWKNRIRTLFGIRSNNLNDILTGANKTIRHIFPNDDYMVMVDDYFISFTIKEKKTGNVLMAKR